MRVALALLLCLALGACANADGSRPRLPTDAPAVGLGGGYAGASAGFGDRGTKAVPF